MAVYPTQKESALLATRPWVSIHRRPGRNSKPYQSSNSTTSALSHYPLAIALQSRYLAIQPSCPALQPSYPNAFERAIFTANRSSHWKFQLTVAVRLLLCPTHCLHLSATCAVERSRWNHLCPPCFITLGMCQAPHNAASNSLVTAM